MGSAADRPHLKRKIQASLVCLLMLKTPESRQRLALSLLWITPALWSVNYIVARTAPGVA